MSTNDQLEALVALGVAVLLGGLVGLDREWRNRPAGLRTHMLVALGAALVMTMSRLEYPPDPSARLVANVISGIGFLGAGVIIQRRAEVHGLTTAASIWLTAMIGLVAGAKLYVLALGASVIAWFLLAVLRQVTKDNDLLNPNDADDTEDDAEEDEPF